MRNLVIAKRYARALFNIALEGGAIEQYAQELDAFVQLSKELPAMADSLKNRLYPEAARKSIFQKLADKIGMTPIMKSFVGLLIEKNRLAHMPEITEYYHKLMDDHANVARAKLRAATKLDDSVIHGIAQTLEKMTGKKIAIEFQTDPSLIGGALVQIGDLVLDGSVRKELINFKESLKRGALG